MVKYSKELKAAEERAHAEWEQYIEKTTPEWERKSREQFLAGPKRPNSPELDLHPLAPPKILITENSIGEKSTKQGRESAMDFEMTKKAKIDTGFKSGKDKENSSTMLRKDDLSAPDTAI
ncbi:hypothetical protein PMZ80_005122 [Knufia obscura]|uniref:Uncharacterized protein n=2 Tax=Knufia TaxID=430999 RepID=A0AAN8EKI8_9EURO|nr:hypothetical protein PMZ80_005122 [Knufia obscura]KAK5957789.1 hypothetical protein OHC33_000978 [Knufia fluminis]